MSHRGLSGSRRRIIRTHRPSTAPRPNARRHPRSGGRKPGLQQEHGQRGAGGRAEPPGAVDRQLDPSADAGRVQLLGRRVDRGVLTADSHPGQEPEHEERRRAPRERRRHGRREIQQQRPHEQPLAPEPVGQVPEQERSDDRARDVDRAHETDLELGQRERVLARQRRGDRADDRDLEPVEDPGDAERDDDQPVPPAPGQPVHPLRDVARDDLFPASVRPCGQFPHLRSQGVRSGSSWRARRSNRPSADTPVALGKRSRAGCSEGEARAELRCRVRPSRPRRAPGPRSAGR